MSRVSVWWLDTGQFTEGDFRGLLSVLSPDECERCARFVQHRDARDYAAAHWLLRSALSRLHPTEPSAWRFTHDALGKPSLDSSHRSALRFSISHTRGLVACAVSSGLPVGVDAESTERAVDFASLAQSFFSPYEVADLFGCELPRRGARFVELWVLKEAFLKAVGVGLSYPLNEFGFTRDEVAGLVFHPPPATLASEWRFALYEPRTTYRLALAVQTRGSVTMDAAAPWCTPQGCPTKNLCMPERNQVSEWKESAPHQTLCLEALQGF